MKRALIFSLFLSIGTFYGIQRNSDYFKEKIGITGLNPVASAYFATPKNKEVLLINYTKQEPNLICIKVEGRIFCKSSEKAI